MKINILLFLVLFLFTNGHTVQEGLKKGDPAPEIVVKNSNGKEKNLTDIHSKVILIDFWAGYCKPCIKSIHTTLKPLYDNYTRERLEIIGINVDTSQELWKKSADKIGIPWLQAHDRDRSLLKAFHVQAIPHYYLLDENKNIIETDLKSGELKKIIRKYLEK